MDAFRRYKLDLGIIAMANAAPDIMRDTAEDAKSQKAICMVCQGTGEMFEHPEDPSDRPVASVCPNCLGDGTFRVPGHDKSRELFFKTMGLTKRDPVFAQQINIGPSSSPPTVEDFVIENQRAEKDQKAEKADK